MTTSTRRVKEQNRQRRWATIGIVAIVVLAGIGYIAYTANLGLPWQSTYDVYVDVPNADRLIKTADVRIGGVRVGQVIGVSAEPGAAGTPGVAARAPYGRIELALDPSVGALPAGTTVRVRPASVLGLTYVGLHLGHGGPRLPAGATLPLTSAKPASDLTDLFQIFNTGTARSFQNAVTGLASGVAGRGSDLNATIHGIAAALPATESVAATLAAAPTQFSRFLTAYEQTVAGLAPEGEQLAGLVSGGAQTLAALDRTRRSLAATIDAAPPAELATATAFTAARPAISGLAQLAVNLEPGSALLAPTVAQINTTLRSGLTPLHRLPPFATKLTSALTGLRRLAVDPNTVSSLRKLTDLSSAGRGALSLLVPAQVTCNVISLFTTGFAGVFGTIGTGAGPSLGNLDLEETGAIGEPLQNAKPSPNVGINPLPTESATDCESGNEPWSGKQQLGNPPGPPTTTVRQTVPPPGTLELARKAGLMSTPSGL